MMQKEPTPKTADLDKRHRSLLVIWAAMLASVGAYAAVAVLARPGGGGTTGDAVGLALVGLGGACVLASFVVKQRLLSRAVAEQRPELVSTAYVVGFALSEAAGLAGLVSAFVVGGGGFLYLLFVVSGVGLLLHFPRRDDLLAAAYEEGRTTITGS